MEQTLATSDVNTPVRVKPRAPWLAFLRQHYPKLLALLFYLGLIAGYWYYAQRNNLSPMMAVHQLVVLLGDSPWGPLLYIAVYAVQPVIAFPVPLLSVTAGVVFGPVVGLLCALIGISISSSFSYLIGRYLGRGLLDESLQAHTLIARYTSRLRCNTFLYVLILRLIFLPYEVVSMLCGFLALPWKPFALGTALGILPGLVALVLFGSSIHGDFTGEIPALTLHPTVLAISVGILIASLGLSWYLKVRHDRNPPSDCPLD